MTCLRGWSRNYCWSYLSIPVLKVRQLPLLQTLGRKPWLHLRPAVYSCSPGCESFTFVWRKMGCTALIWGRNSFGDGRDLYRVIAFQSVSWCWQECKSCGVRRRANVKEPNQEPVARTVHWEKWDWGLSPGLTSLLLGKPRYNIFFFLLVNTYTEQESVIALQYDKTFPGLVLSAATGHTRA